MTDIQSIVDYLKSSEISYILLIFVIFIVPKLLQRYRIPAAISSFALGIAAGPGFGFFQGNETVKLLATLGIVSLFLHAGLDINISELKKNRRILSQHVLFFVGLLVLITLILQSISDFSFRVCILVSLALVTPSTGFILDSLSSFGLTNEEQGWVRAKAIATELVALVCMFFTLQSMTIETFLVSIAVVLTLVILVPLLFRFFAVRIAPFAPNSDFAFLIMLATACAFVTRKIGAYYLVGAFVVGVAARRFEEKIPSVTSERLIGAIELFASFFVPFYFFHSGSLLTQEDFSVSAWLVGATMFVIMIPIRTLMVSGHRKRVLKESIWQGSRVAIPMLPTLVFTLVLAQLMREQFQIPSAIFGGLIIYAVANSLLVGFVFRSPEHDFSADMEQDSIERARSNTSRHKEKEDNS